MSINNNITGLVCLLLVSIAAICLGGKRINLKKILSRQRHVLVKNKEMVAGRIQVQLLSPGEIYENTTRTNSLYMLKIRLQLNGPVDKGKLLQYMNLGIGNYFFAMQGGDTLRQVACEKIPCINRNEFIYITCFDKPPSVTGSSLLVYLADPVAGFGNSRFEFTRKDLQYSAQ